MATNERQVSGLDAVALATALLRRMRLVDPDGGIWDAADVQWWWRTPRASDGLAQTFWLDDAGPVGAALATEFGGDRQLDAIVLPEVRERLLSVAWSRALDASGAHSAYVIARDDEDDLLGLLRAASFVTEPEVGGSTWMHASDVPAPVHPPEGFAIVDRTVRAAAEHPLARRNGPAVERRLRDCPLYRPDLDLVAITPVGEVAGYALYWLDPVTGVGMLEPMRVEDAYQRRGIARALTSEGLQRLARLGAKRLKVGYAGEVGRALYTGMGFRITSTNRTHVRAAQA